jgi:CDP-glucose 4,6-dehydratase
MHLNTPIDFKFWRNKKVLITGHNGFKGTWLTLWLNILGCKVTGYSLLPNTIPSLFNLTEAHKYCTSITGDIRDLNLFSKIIQDSKPDLIFHLAAQPLVMQGYKDPLETFTTNINGTINLLESVRNFDKKIAIVIITTDKVYKITENFLPFTEFDQLGGLDPYSASKASCELIVDCYRNSYFSSHGINVATARAGNVIGGGDWAADRLIPDAIKAWNVGGVLQLRNPDSFRPWQHVLEPLYGYMILGQLLYQNEKYAQAYNIGPAINDAATVASVIEIASLIWGKTAQFNFINENNNLINETKLLLLNNRKTSSELGVNPIWKLDLAISKTVEWYKNYLTGQNPLKLCLDDIEFFNKSL